MGRSRQFEALQLANLERLKAHIPPACPLLVERVPAEEAHLTRRGFLVTGPGCEYSGPHRAALAFIDGYVAAWMNAGGEW